MMKYLMAFTVFFIAIAVSFSSVQAQSTLMKQAGKEGRTYHKDLYMADKCVACHGTSTPKANTHPNDKVCLDCHDLEELVKATARVEEDKWQNPHNNLHYGKDTPCVECHSEHKVKKPICEDCHTFDFSKHKN